MGRIRLRSVPTVLLVHGTWVGFAGVGLAPSCSDPGGVNQEPLILWQVPAQSASAVPLVLESVLVFGALDGSAIALDRQTGRTRWKRQLGEGEVLGTAVKGAGGFAIVPQYEVWALDPHNGQVRWRFGGPDGAAGAHDVATAGDTVFTGSAVGWASAVDARTGEAFWSVDLDESPFRPTVAGDLVIYGTRGFLGPHRQGPLGGGPRGRLTKE
jgi:outer membrane protein assembly factor BamB